MAEKKILINLDLNQNQLLNALLQVLASDPGSPAEGQVWYRSDEGEIRWYDGTVIRKIAELTGSGAAEITYNGDGTVTVEVNKAGVDALGVDADTLDGQEGSWYQDRANHTGTQAHTTISDFDAGVQANRLDQMAAPTADVGLNGQKATGLADPTAAQDAATKAYVDAARAGLDVKQSVRAASTGNIDLSTGGTQTIDGVSLSADDRVLVKDQTTASENGIYLVKAGSWVRADDADEDSEVTAGMFTFVEEGTEHDDTGWILSTNDPITVGTTDLDFVQFSGPGAGGIGRYSETIGDGATTSFTVTHNLGSNDIHAIVREVSSGDMVLADVSVSDTNTITVDFAEAPATDEYRVVVIG